MNEPMDSAITLLRPSLPPELLTWIFIQVCTDTPPCPWSAPVDIRRPMFKFTNYPVVLSHVCVAWRRMAIATTCLWTHIDLDPRLVRDGQLVLPPRGETYLARAGNQLLDIHAMINTRYPECDSAPTISEQNVFLHFLENISPRAWSMIVVLPNGRSVWDFCQRTISVALQSCIPGVLTRLSIEIANCSLFAVHPPNPPPEQLNDTLEALGHSITVLRLHRYFPQWKSKMYHGLTEFRLKGRGQSISKPALIHILSSCPKLQILEIEICISDYASRLSITPIPLMDLELLISAIQAPWDGALLLRMIRPGPKPLAVSMDSSLISSILSYGLSWDDHAIERFFAHANITRLIIYKLSDYADLTKLLLLTPNVQVLALEQPVKKWVSLNEAEPAPVSKLDTFYLATDYSNSTNLWPSVEKFAQRYGVRKLKWWTRFREDVSENLFVSSRVTIIPHGQPNPIEEYLNSNNSSLDK